MHGGGCGGGGIGGFGGVSAPSLIDPRRRHEGPRPGRRFGDGAPLAGRAGTLLLLALMTLLVAALIVVSLVV